MTQTALPRLTIRIGILGLLVVIVQIAAVSQVAVFGGVADLTPLLAMAIGLLCGSLVGACAGFYLGLLVDTALLQTLGLTSLLLLSIGYFAGRLRELRDPAHGLTPVAVGAMAAAAFAIGFSLLQFLLGVDGPVSAALVREMILSVAFGALLALPVYMFARRMLLPVLPEDPRRRRRRAYTTGGLSPISRA